MLDLQATFHLGMCVLDLDAAMADLSSASGMTWARPVVRNQKVWTPAGGTDFVPLRFVYSCEGPIHVELLEGPPGSVWDGALHVGWHHLGIWAQDVLAETERLIALGWTLELANADREEDFGVFTNLRSPIGNRIEFVSTSARPRFERWWAGGELA